MHYGPGSEIGKVETVRVEGAWRIRLLGECDACTAPAVQAHVEALLGRGESRLVFDLEHVTFVDSTILRIILGARRQLAPDGGEVVLLCRPGFVRRLLGLLEMDRLLRILTPEEFRRQVAAVN
ncbi:MAG TPA: STAS domain-containing protein [Armatimonadota bacterium]|nr:STAS domain-containing protein [Armatimonadota bacterium]